MKNINFAILLIVVSLASLGGLVYPTIPVTETSNSLTTIPPYTVGSTSTVTVTETGPFLFLLFHITNVTAPPCGQAACTFTTLVGGQSLTYVCSPLIYDLACNVTVTATGASTYSVTVPPIVSTNIVTRTSEVGYAISGTGGTLALLLVVALFLASVGLLVRARKAISKAVKVQ